VSRLLCAEARKLLKVTRCRLISSFPRRAVLGVVAQCWPEGVDDLLWPVGAWSTACEYRGEQGAQCQVEHAFDVEVGANLASLVVRLGFSW
jgi:hypothetical protein